MSGVRKLQRRMSGLGSSFEPWSLAYHTLYVLVSSGRGDWLVTPSVEHENEY
jgi:hypothetical protein